MDGQRQEDQPKPYLPLEHAQPVQFEWGGEVKDGWLVGWRGGRAWVHWYAYGRDYAAFVSRIHVWDA